MDSEQPTLFDWARQQESSPQTPEPSRRGKDLTGLSFGRLRVIRLAGRNKRQQLLWQCACACGGQAVTSTNNLTSGHSSSCGCLCRERRKASTTKHGKCKNPEYQSWTHMLQRCTNPNNDRWKDYGGRGITVCERWRNSFEAFLEDMGSRPSKSHTIERRDNSKGYEPGNCFWGTKKQQLRNTRRNRLVTHQGRTLCVSEWAEERGLSYCVLFARIHRGWPVAEALGFAPRGSTSGGCS